MTANTETKRHENKKKRNWGLVILGWILTLVVFFPLYMAVVNSFKNRRQIFTDQLGWPETWSLEYYVEAASKMSYFNALRNSIWVVGWSVLFIILFASMAGWALERRRSKASNVLYIMFIASMLVPFQSVMIPLVQYLTQWRFEISGFNFRMVGSHYGLIFMNIGFGMALSIFLYHGFVKSIPLEMEESAMIDGAGRWQIFFRIILPNLKAISATVAILNIISYWNDYLLPSLVILQPSLRTIPLSTFYFFGEFNIQWNLALAGLVLTILPVILFYIFAQRWVIGGVLAGAVKG